jgi:hypothetical protein
MKPFSPFDHRRDKVLGDTLRDLLTPDDHESFVERVMERVGSPAADSEGWLDVLNTWAWPGLVAAAALTGVALFASLPSPEAPVGVGLEATISQVAEQEELSSFLVANEPPDFDIILTSGVVSSTSR